jgi:uncharacterized protein (TIGR03083 family)
VVEPVDVPREVARLRNQFADRVESLEEQAWSTPSWCSDWLVRDVLAHLVQNAERTYASLTVDLLRGGLGPDRAMRKAATRLRHVPVPELAGRLRRASGRHFHLHGSPEAMGLADLLVHGADALRPVGLDIDAPPPDAALALEALWKTGRMIVHAVPQEGRRLVATDLEWSRGTGPEVRGRTVDLLLLVANRPQVSPWLHGTGVEGLWT